MVAPDWQGRGLGTALQQRLQEYAASRGVRGFTAEILARNASMLRLARSARGSVSATTEDGEAHVTVLFTDGVPPGPA
ncbi:MAG: GNAT family N-acetyltransferase [Rhizobacter sp.]|nr:GNAT family N-acetyltransferase [Chlorobiales bacterium]